MTRTAACTDPSKVGQRIINALDRIKQTQEWLALQADVSPAYISQIIRGARTNPTFAVVRKIEEVLNENIW